MTTFTTQDRQDAQREPVAFMNVEPAYLGWDSFRKDDVPLYTKQNQLSNKRIRELAMECEDPDFLLDEMAFNYYEFARAIERAHGIGE